MKEKPTKLRPKANSSALPGSSSQKDWGVLLLGLMMFMAPTMGVPSEEMLQDTLKSMVVAAVTLIACLTYFWHQKNRDTSSVWHPLMWLPLALMVYALGSMIWSHAYLAGVEAVRWFVFSLILWLGTNVLSQGRAPRLALGIHLGATFASVWTALQFWIDFKYFPQGPNPASTFVNRNFFAEFAVCALPFSVFLLTREKGNTWATALAFSIALNLTALMMSGTRSALVALSVLAVVFAIILSLYWRRFESSRWSKRMRVEIGAILILGTISLGAIPTNNSQLISELGRANAIERAFSRTTSMAKATEYTEGSFYIRTLMWKATGRMIEDRPFSGVGAGAWEVQVPLYQNAGTQLETDFYAHNELLQLLSEYGLVGWAFLAGLFFYLSQAAFKTWKNQTPEGNSEAPLRAFTLASLLALLIVSNAGFPWRLASTGALFALSLALLAASDARLASPEKLKNWSTPWKKSHTRWALYATTCVMAVALYISQQATQAERKLVRGIKLALTISQSGQPNHPRWNDVKTDSLELVRQGIEINPHYRKLTPMAADELANWGDWKNATWIWESVLESRPNVVAIAANISRGYLRMGNYPKAMDYFNRAQKINPTSPAVRSLEVILLMRTEQYPEAASIVRELFLADTIDYDLVYSAYLIGIRSQDWALAIQALEYRIRKWPHEATDGWLKLGDIYSRTEVKNESAALESYRQALQTTSQARESILGKIPQAYREKLQQVAAP